MYKLHPALKTRDPDATKHIENKLYLIKCEITHRYLQYNNHSYYYYYYYYYNSSQ